MTCYGHLHYFLCISLHHTKKNMFLSYYKYDRDIVLICPTTSRTIHQSMKTLSLDMDLSLYCNFAVPNLTGPWISYTVQQPFVYTWPSRVSLQFSLVRPSLSPRNSRSRLTSIYLINYRYKCLFRCWLGWMFGYMYIDIRILYILGDNLVFWSFKFELSYTTRTYW